MNTKELMFNLLRESALAQCGDGVAVVVSKQYEQLAEDFLEYEKSLEKPYFTNKRISETYGTITFDDGREFNQEGIVFGCDISIKSLEMYDIVIFC